MEKIKVLHVITRLVAGGAQQNTLMTVKKLNPERYFVCLASGPTDGSEGSLEDEAKALGSAFFLIPELVRQISPFNDLIAFFKLYHLMKIRRFHIVHTHTSKAGIVGRLAARAARTPVVVHTPHGHVFHGYFSKTRTKIFINLERMAARMTDALIALTDACKNEHLEKGVGTAEQFSVIFSGVELEPFLNCHADKYEVKKSLGIDPSSPVVGTVSRLVPVKGCDYFLRAAKMVLLKHPETVFLVVGDGPLRTDLLELSKSLGVNKHVRFLGLRRDVPQLLKCMDVFVLSSLNEGMGKAVLEAMASRIPVAATEVGGVCNLVENQKTGLLCPPKDPASLSETILLLLENKDFCRQLAEEAFKTVFNFTAEKMVQEIETLYEKLIENGIVN